MSIFYCLECDNLRDADDGCDEAPNGLGLICIECMDADDDGEEPRSANHSQGDAAGLGTIHVCQGPPRCDLLVEAAVSAMEAGCIWCRRIVVFVGGEEVVTEPSHD